ncbi:hypothetical protein AALB51_23265 [Lachnospiraceae bacterium 62-26]|jgi:hypothetical protein
MKKKELMKIDPPEFTPYLKRIAKKDRPVKSQYWGADKNYKYGKYLRVKEEKGYLVVSVFLARLYGQERSIRSMYCILTKEQMILLRLRRIPANGESPCCITLTGQDICTVRERISAGEIKNWFVDIWGLKRESIKNWNDISLEYGSSS